MDFSLLAILSTMIVGFISVVISVNTGIRSELKQKFNELKEDMNRRFNEQDKKFVSLKQDIDRRFEEQKDYMDRRFDEVDHKFLQQKEYMDQRFDEQKEYMDHRFEQQKEEIVEIKQDQKSMRARLDTFIDNFALKVITEGQKPARKSV